MGIYFGPTLSWSIISNLDFFASGGTITEATINDVVYRIHSFTTTGSSTFTTNRNLNIVEYLIVGGGGGSGGVNGVNATGAGGGGGLLTNLNNSPISLTAQSYPIVVGAGGSGGAVGKRGNPGDNSSAFGLTSFGGGGGGGADSILEYDGGNGGSGGGGGPDIASIGGNGTAGQGNNGGNRYGGGGGAGSAGQDVGTGVGLQLSITGSNVWYAGGGGGPFKGGSAPLGGGGNPDTTSNGGQSTDGTPNTGGGGGGRWGSITLGRNGGSGIVVVRYPIGIIGQ